MQRTGLSSWHGVVLAPAGIALTLALGGAARLGGHTWVGGADLMWANPSNWQPNSVPGSDVAGASVEIKSADGLIIAQTLNLNLGELSADVAVKFAGGTVDIQDSNTTDLELSNGVVLTVNGELALYGTTQWINAHIKGAGVVQVRDTLAISALSAVRRVDMAMDNIGTVEQSGKFNIGNGATANNAGVWKFTSPGPANIEPITDAPVETFSSEGELRRTGSGTTEIWTAFRNKEGGSIHGEAGEIMFKSSNKHEGGEYTVANGAAVRFWPDTSITSEFTGNTTLKGRGLVMVNNGALKVEGGVTLTNQMISDWPKGFFLQANGTGIEVAGVLRNEGRMIWESGSIHGSGRVENAAGGTAHLQSPGSLRTEFTNLADGTVYQFGNLFLDGGIVRIEGSSIWTLGSHGILWSGGGGTVHVKGTLLSTGAAGAGAVIGVPAVIEGGKVQVSGTEPMRFGNGGAIIGGGNKFVMPAASNECVLDAGTFVVSGQATVEGDGRLTSDSLSELNFSGGTFTVNFGSELRLSSAQLRSATLHDCIVNQGQLTMSSTAVGTAAGSAVRIQNSKYASLTGPNTIRGVFLNGTGGSVQQTGGTQTVASGGLIQNDASWSTNASITANPGGMITNSASGTMNVTASNDPSITGPFSNAGLVYVIDGTLTVSNVAQVINGTLTGGRWTAELGGEIVFAGTEISVIGASTVVRLEGPNAAQMLADAHTFGKGSTVILTDIPFGQIQLPSLQHTDGLLAVNGVIVSLSRGVLHSGGILEMDDENHANFEGGAESALVVAVLENSGRIRPGGAGGAGPFNLTGALLQQPSGAIEIELGGLAPSDSHDAMSVDGSVALAGTLEVSLLPGFEPEVGQQFTVLTSTGAITGDFDAVVSSRAGTYSVAVQPNQIVLTLTAKFVLADLTGDGLVDGADLGTLLGEWGTDDANADLNDDGIVDGADLGVLLGEWSAS